MNEHVTSCGDTTPATFTEHATTDAPSEVSRTCTSKPGAPLENGNAGKHFLRGGGWPKDAVREQRRVQALTRALTVATIAAHGEVDLVNAAIIQTAGRWERVAQLANRWLRLECDKLNASERLAFARETARASEARDRAIRELNIGSKANADPWALIDARIVEADPTQGESNHLVKSVRELVEKTTWNSPSCNNRQPTLGKADAPASHTEPQGGNQ